MGGAMIRGWIESGHVTPQELTAVAVHETTLEAMRALGVTATTDAAGAVREAEVVILAVKPWLIEGVAQQIADSVPARALVGSVAAGISVETLVKAFGGGRALFRIMPNTAVRVRQGMTFLTAAGATDEQLQTMTALFEALGRVMVVPEAQLDSCMALASCGIAYALRYVRAAMEGGVELGLKPAAAQEMVAQTLVGAAELLLQTGNHPEAEIDRVTTPGGVTIRGLNAMEAHGFSHAVIEGLKASTVK